MHNYVDNHIFKKLLFLIYMVEICITRYAYPWWKEKVIDSDFKRKEGLCPLTPEETALILTALGINHDVQIYIAAGEIYGGSRRMLSLAAAYPNLVCSKKKMHDFFFFLESNMRSLYII